MESLLLRVLGTIDIHKFLSNRLHHRRVRWLYPCIIGLGSFFTFTIGERVRSELLWLIFRTLATGTTAEFLRVISKSKTVILWVWICGLDSWCRELCVILELRVTVDELGGFGWIIDDVVVDVVVVYDISDVAWFHCKFFLVFFAAWMHQTCIFVSVCDWLAFDIIILKEIVWLCTCNWGGRDLGLFLGLWAD